MLSLGYYKTVNMFGTTNLMFSQWHQIYIQLHLALLREKVKKMLIKSDEVLTGMKVWIRKKKFIQLFCCLLMLFKRNIYTDLPRTLSTFFPLLNWKTNNFFFLKLGFCLLQDQKGVSLYLGVTHQGIMTFHGSRRTQLYKW